MRGGRRLDQTKGVFCLETDRWYGPKDLSSVEPILSLLERLKDYEVPYLHKRVATRVELEHSIKRYLQPMFKTHPVLYLAFHGSSEGDESGLSVDDGHMDIDELAKIMAGRCAYRVVYFGCCWTLNVDDEKLSSFLRKTGAMAICGYKEEVDWVESMAFDLLFLGKLQWETLRRRDNMRHFNTSLKNLPPGLYRNLGFRMIVRAE